MAPAENRTITDRPAPAISDSFVSVYRIDSKHAGAHFRVRHMMISWVNGEFGHITGSVVFDPANLNKSSIDATIDAATVSTREPARDRHLKSADFLDVVRYPAITFHSTQIIPVGENSYTVNGELTIHGVTREIKLHVEFLTPEIRDPDGLLRRGARATTRIERQDFRLMWNAVLESGGFVVGNDVEITIDVELVRQTE